MIDHTPCTVDGCDTPTPDQLCKRHRADLRNALQQLPGLLAELEVTTTRQAVTTRGSGGGSSTKASEEPIPFDVDASEMDWAVRNTVTTWARVVVEERYAWTTRMPPLLAGPTCSSCFHGSCSAIRACATQRAQITEWRKHNPPRHFATLCGWLAHQLSWVVQQQWAQQMHDEITSIRPFANRTVDNREDRYAGPCTAQVVALDLVEADGLVGFDTTDRQCGTDLRLRNGAQRIVCRTCGADYDAGDRANWISKQSAEQLATATLIAQALTEAGTPVKAATIRKWAERTRAVEARNGKRGDGDPFESEPQPIVQVACRVTDRVPLYRVGDVYERVKARPSLTVVGERISA